MSGFKMARTVCASFLSVIILSLAYYASFVNAGLIANGQLTAYATNSPACDPARSAVNGVNPSLTPFCDLTTLIDTINVFPPNASAYDVQVYLVGDSSVAFGTTRSNNISMSVNVATFEFTGQCTNGPCLLTCSGNMVTGLGFILSNFEIGISNITISGCYVGINVTWARDFSPPLVLRITNATVQYSAWSPLSVTSVAYISYYEYASTITLDHVKMLNSTGPTHIIGEEIMIQDCTFSSNQLATDTPFKIHLVNGTTAAKMNLSILRSYISNGNAGESAVGGGGIYVIVNHVWQNATVTIEDSTFFNNTAAQSGGALKIDVNVPTEMSITRTTFASNSAINYGGAVYIFQNAVYNASSSLYVDDCIFTNNVAGGFGYGGALLYDRPDYDPPTVTVTSSIFRGNSAPAGPAIWMSGVNLNLTSCSITQNTGNVSVVALTAANVSTIWDNTISYNTLTNDNSAALALYTNVNGSVIDVYGNTISSNYGKAGGISTYTTSSDVIVLINASYIWSNAGFALQCNGSSTIDASGQNSIYRNAWGIAAPNDVQCSACQIILPGNQTVCNNCSGTSRDICSICGGNSACVDAGCSIPYSPCVPPALVNEQSQVSVQYTGINPIIQANTTQIVTLDFSSLTDVGNGITYLLGNISFLQSKVISSDSQTVVAFEGILPNGAKIAVQQALFGVGQDVPYAGTTFTVNDSTLKTTLTIADWPTSDTVRLEMNLLFDEKVTRLTTTERQQIIEETLLGTKHSRALLSLANVYVTTKSDGSLSNVAAAISYDNQGTSVRVSVEFAGPIGTLEYDPDISAIVGGVETGDGDGTDKKLVAILVPVLVGGACLCVCAIIIVGAIFLTALRVYRRHKRAESLRDGL